MNNTITKEQTTALLNTLQTRFEKNMHRHRDVSWQDVQSRLNEQPHKLWSLLQMEETGGEPDVVGRDPSTNEILFYDCAVQTPSGRRSVCYDQAALDARKANKPGHSAMGMAAEMGIELLGEEEYRQLQKFQEFDTKTSSWIATPANIRQLGGALFCDCRYQTVFVYHNGADSYYGVRGFRGKLLV